MSAADVLGRPATGAYSPDQATLDRVADPHADIDYVIRFTCPEFTSLCPATGQLDFAHLVIDYVADQWIVESKWLKLCENALREPPESSELLGPKLFEVRDAHCEWNCLAVWRLISPGRSGQQRSPR